MRGAGPPKRLDMGFTRHADVRGAFRNPLTGLLSALYLGGGVTHDKCVYVAYALAAVALLKPSSRGAVDDVEHILIPANPGHA
jgi:hypothetical protein